MLTKRKTTISLREIETTATAPNSQPNMPAPYGYLWQKVRDQHLKIEPLCRACKQAGRVTAGTPEQPLHVDHITPIKQGGAEFSHDNLQTLCIDHHNQKTAAERAGKPWRRKGCDANGMPLDPGHHWHG